MPRLLAALLLALAALPARAEPWHPVAEGHARIAFLSGWREPDGSRMAAIAVELAPGWHTYWRVPGAAGIPPQLDWSGSRNLRSARLVWPLPSVFSSYGLRTIGYREDLTLPVVLTPEQADLPIAVALDLLIGVCESICVPARASLGGLIAPDTPEAGRGRIEAALSRRVHNAGEAGVDGATCAVAPGPEGMEVTATVQFSEPPPEPQTAVLEAADPDLWIGEPVSTTAGATVTAQAALDWLGAGAMLVDRSALRLTLIDDQRAVEITGCPAP